MSLGMGDDTVVTVAFSADAAVHLLMGDSEGKASAYNAGDPGSIPGLGRSPGEGNGNPLQYSCLENPMDGGAWWATVHEVTKSQTWLNFTFPFTPSFMLGDDHDVVRPLSQQEDDFALWCFIKLWRLMIRNIFKGRILTRDFLRAYEFTSIAP